MVSNINLLPWRDQQRQREKVQFITSLLACVVGVLGIIFCMHYFLGVQLTNQTLRNQMLKNAILVLDAQLSEIKNLQKNRDILISRTALLHDLQTTSIRVVHLFDELSKIIPPEIYVTHMAAENNNASVTGHAKTNRYISQFMRHIEHNQWLHHPVLHEIRRTAKDKQATDNEFKLTFLFRSEYQRNAKP